MSRSALGERVDSGTATPAHARELKLAVANIPAAGLWVEQVEQLAIFDDAEPSEPRSVVVLREGDASPRTLTVPAPDEPDKAGEEGGALASSWVPSGEGDALGADIGDLPDEIGDLLASTSAGARPIKWPNR